MKVTDELRRKISKSVQDKYQAEQAKINAEIVEIRAKHTALVIATIAPQITPAVEKLLGRYSIDWQRSIERKATDFIACPKLDELHTTNSKILDDIDNEISNLLVTVSYGKDIEDIKKAFGDYGLKF